MKKLKLVLFGRPQIVLDGKPVNSLSSSKAQALLFYLAVTGQAHARGVLATLLWPDSESKLARTNLRVELHNLRKVLPEFISASRQTIAFKSETEHEVDVLLFELYLGKSEVAAEELEAAVALYRGEFLDQFDVRESDEFETWVRNTRERLHEMALQAMFDLAVQCTENGDYAAGIEQLNRMLAFEAWREEAHQQLMLLLALSGRRADALLQYEICCKVLEQEVGVPPTAETIGLYQQILDGEIHGESLVHLGLAQPETKEAPFMAPPLKGHFVGRVQNISTIVNLLHNSAAGQNVVAVVGMGGVGKTTIATHVAHEMREQFTDGVLWGNVATSEPQAILIEWARALGYDFSGVGRLDELVAVMRTALAAKNVLLVVDDVQSVARLRPLVEVAGDRPLLVTTRSWEWARSLQMQIVPLEELTPDDGQQLMVNILGAARVAAESAAAERICELLQNLPLAIEIAAQRLKAHPRRRLEDMAERLRHESERLSLSHAEDLAVRTSFEVSWNALSDDLRRMFVRLAVFRGRSFTPLAMAAISDLDRYAAEDKLFILTDLSLLSEGSNRRYYQHSLLADFAREKLSAAPWHAEPYQKMAHYFYDFARENQRDYDALRPEWDNLMAGIYTAREQQLWQLVLDYALILTEPWFRRGRFMQAALGYRLAFDAARQLEDEPTIATVTYHWGRAHIHQGDYDEAGKLLANSLDLYRSLEDQPQQAAVLYELAEINLEQTNLDEARQFLDEATHLLNGIEADTNGTQVRILYKLADIAYSKGHWEEAAELAQQACQHAEQIQDTFYCAQAWRLLASIRVSQRDYEAARICANQAYELYKGLNDKKGMALTLRVQGTIDLFAFLLKRRPDLGLAESYIQQSLEISELTGDRRSQAQSLWLSSRIQRALTNLPQAQQEGVQALEMCRRLGDEMGQMMLFNHLGDVYQDQSNTEQAKQCWQEALVLAQKYGHPNQGELEQKLANL